MSTLKPKRNTSFFLFNGDSRPVANILGAAGQVVEQCCFSAVRVSCEGNFNTHGAFTSLCSNYCLETIPVQVISRISASALRMDNS